jgi:thiol-disulfide isomerase/thioredoxin
MKSLFLLAILLICFTFASAQHEFAPVQEHEFKYKDWTYKSVHDSKELNLRDFTNGKKLIMVVYFATWCPNWKLEAPVAQKFYDKYKSQGFDVIGVGEYAAATDTKTYLDDKKITFPVVYESETREDKTKTAHYDYRKQTGDTRNWGSPWNIFLEPVNIEKKGDTLTKKAFVVNGELIEDETEKFIRQKLGLPAEETKAEITKAKEKEIETCDPAKKTIVEFKKP